ncbi:hypothetical protein VPH35_010782 [Triticum aestivum]
MCAGVPRLRAQSSIWLLWRHRLPAPWSELPPDVLHLVIDRLISSPPRRGFFSSAWSLVRSYRRRWVFAGLARFRAVCRSWHLAMRLHLSASRQLPWIVMSDGSFYTPSDAVCTSPPRLPTLPGNTTCIGSTDDWIALDFTDAKNMHSYSLHNPFAGTTVPLPELDAIIVLLRSTPSDIIAVMTNNCNHPLILIQTGKGVWLPKPQTAPFIYIVDIAFLGDKLYGITEAEDLVSLGIDFDSDGIPAVTSIERLIRHPPGYYHFGVWSDDDDDFESGINDVGNKDKVMNINEAHIEVPSNEDPEEHALDELRKKTGDGMILEGATCWLDDEVPYEPKDMVTLNLHLVKSRGKLLMVKRQLHWPSYSINFTRKVEVYEADVNGGAHWVPISGGLGNVDQDALHFIDTGEKYDMKSQSLSPTWKEIDYHGSTWIFSPELVV